MGKPLTPDLVLSRSKCDNLQQVRNLNLWGNDIDDVRLLRQMPNVEILSLSVNKISSLKEFGYCSKLQELYLRKNCVSDISEIRHLRNLQHLKVLWLWDNPCAEQPNYREIVIKHLPNLVKLDNNAVTPEEKAAAEKLPISLSDLIPKDAGPANDNNSVGVNPPTLEKKSSYTTLDQGNMMQPNNNILNKNVYGGNAGPVDYNANENIKENANPALKAKKDGAITPPMPPSNVNSRTDNVLTAILALLRELDESGLDVVKRDVDRKLAALAMKK